MGIYHNKHGLESNDKIVQIDGTAVENKEDISKVLANNNGEELSLKVERNGELIDIYLMPTEKQVGETSVYYIGVAFKQVDNTFGNHIYYGLVKTANFSISIIDNLKTLFTGGISVDQMMGPVGISDVVASTSGVKEFIYILALISLSLGITNLLPIPGLDGGKLVLLVIEAIRRKPLKQETEASLTLLGFSLLIALSVYVTYNDILRIF